MPSYSYNSNAAIIKQGQLLVKREKGRRLYLLPGGGIETGENSSQALTLELGEELGISVNKDNLEFIGELSTPSAGRKTVRKTHLFLVKD